MMLSSKRKNSVYIAIPAADVNDVYGNDHFPSLDNDKRVAATRSKKNGTTTIKSIIIVGSGFIAMLSIIFYCLNLHGVAKIHSCQNFREESIDDHRPTFHPYIRNHDPIELRVENKDASRTIFRPDVTAISRTNVTAGSNEVNKGIISRDNDTRNSSNSPSSSSLRTRGPHRRKNRSSLLPASVTSTDRSKRRSSKDTEEEDYFVSDVLPLPIPKKNGMPRFVVSRIEKINS